MRMLGAYSLASGDFLSTFVLFFFLFFVLLFLSVVLYWFNRTHRVPSLRLVGHTMLVSLRTFPRIIAHRVGSIPGRIRHRLNSSHPKPSPYPASKTNRVSTKTIKKKLKRKIGK